MRESGRRAFLTGGMSLTYVDAEEATRAEASIAGTLGRPWELWKRKALAK